MKEIPTFRGSSAYRVQRYLKTYRMSPEEWEVSQALMGYTDDPDKTSARDFVPTRVLYETYFKWKRMKETSAENDGDAGIPVEYLNTRQFGAALRRIFANLGQYAHFRCRRTYHGKQEWGFIHMMGPKSVVTQDTVGRPRTANESTLLIHTEQILA